ncbi:MAG TPA: hypothetical protein VLK27_13655 [Chthoniobacterales bacterium]|nr:hypothetical protein [Chthoniobacterales bacterium]
MKRTRSHQKSIITERLFQIDDSAEKAAKLEMREKLMKLRETTLELEQENLALREEIKRLRESEKPQESLQLCENVYWLLSDSERVGPFCPHCYTKHRRLASLLDATRFVAKTRWICPVCNHVFDSET